MMKLYGRANAWNVRKVVFLLEDIGTAYERLDYGRGFAATDTPDFLALNPNGMVPVLVDGDAVVWESHAILRYIAAKYAPESYYPSAQPLRAHVEQWLDWKLGHISPPLRALFFKYFLNSGDFGDKEIGDAERECIKLFTLLDNQLGKTGGYVTGPDLTIADCALGMAVHRWLGLPLQRPHLTHIDRYYAALSERPAYQKGVLIGMP